MFFVYWKAIRSPCKCNHFYQHSHEALGFVFFGFPVTHLCCHVILTVASGSWLVWNDFNKRPSHCDEPSHSKHTNMHTQSTREHWCYILTLLHTFSFYSPCAVIKHTLPPIHKALLPGSDPLHLPFQLPSSLTVLLRINTPQVQLTSPLEAVRSLLLYTLGLNKAIFSGFDWAEQMKW